MQGVYKILNEINGKFYIGSSKNIKKRWTIHKRQLNAARHHNLYLQRSWTKYGGENFSFSILEETSELFLREEALINELKPAYNIGSIGGGDNLSKNPRRDDIICKIKKSINETISNMSKEDRLFRWSKPNELNPNWKGGLSKVKNSCEICHDKISTKDHKRCVKCSKIGEANPFFGRKHSEESKRKLSESRKGKYNGNQRKQISINDVIFESCSAAAKALGVSCALISYRIKKGFEGYVILQSEI